MANSYIFFKKRLIKKYMESKDFIKLTKKIGVKLFHLNENPSLHSPWIKDLK
jgi:hypothetical protein